MINKWIQIKTKFNLNDRIVYFVCARCENELTHNQQDEDECIKVKFFFFFFPTHRVTEFFRLFLT